MEYYTVADLMKLIGMSRSTVHAMLRDMKIGLIQTCKRGKFYVSKDEVLRKLAVKQAREGDDE